MIEASALEVFVTQNVNVAFSFIACVFANFSRASQTKGLVEMISARDSRTLRASRMTNDE